MFPFVCVKGLYFLEFALPGRPWVRALDVLYFLVCIWVLVSSIGADCRIFWSTFETWTPALSCACWFEMSSLHRVETYGQCIPCPVLMRLAVPQGSLNSSLML